MKVNPINLAIETYKITLHCAYCWREANLSDLIRDNEQWYQTEVGINKGSMVCARCKDRQAEINKSDHHGLVFSEKDLKIVKKRLTKEGYRVTISSGNKSHKCQHCKGHRYWHIFGKIDKK